MEVIFGFLGFLWIFLGFFRNFLKIIGGSWRSLKNFAMLSGGWKEGMAWLQKLLENENGLSGFFCLDFLKIFGYSGFCWMFLDLEEGFAVKLGSPGGSGTALFKDRDYYCRMPNTQGLTYDDHMSVCSSS